MSLEIITGLIVFIFGVFIGSFLNVCILRLPIQETLVSRRSHCMKCGYQ
nr:prepilin peptidase [Lachnospiraceae bacterium]